MSSASGSGIMNGVHRFLSRRDKRHAEKRGRSKTRPHATHLYGMFSSEPTGKKSDKEEEKKVKNITQRLNALGITSLKEPQIEYALRSKYAEGDVDKAYELLVIFEDSVEGILRDYDPNVKMLGAINRESVTCYLDALLFAMFARLDSFEGMLYDNFSDEPRRKLAGVLRLWVNLLRSGKLITTDITNHLQDAISSSGWEEAALLCQQDASEAFTFITGKLELPLLTLKMDLYHAGKEDKEDDHKFVNERLLEVAIPAPNPETGNAVTLEECLETYFNNRIEVKRHLQRRNTMRSVKSTDKYPEVSKDQAIHIETVEIASRSSSPPPLTPSSTSTPQPPPPPRRPIDGRRRADSIFSERYVLTNGEPSEKKPVEEVVSPSTGRARGASIRKEVMMPAWQFFSLIPWYTDNAPQNDAQVAAHFAAKRPILGICLKRYSMTPAGTPVRLDTYVDIPLEIALPHFVSDDRLDEEGPLFGNFKLSLQSVVCHRGVSVDSGHYVSIIRGEAPKPQGSQLDIGNEPVDRWMLFDDLAPERVSPIDVKEALKTESPYLLFYRVEPIDEELARGAPPTYEEANSRGASFDPSMETIVAVVSEHSTSSMTDPSVMSEVTAVDGTLPPLTTISSPTSTERVLEIPDSPPKSQAGDAEVTDFASRGMSLDLPRLDDGPRGRSSTSSENRRSIAFEDGSVIGGSTRGNTAPPTPAEEKKGGFFSSRRGSKVGKQNGKSRSRPPSQSGENRLSATLTMLTSRMSKDKLTSGPASSDGMKTPLEEVPPSLGDATDSDVKEKVSVDAPGSQANPKPKKKKDKGKEKERRSRSVGRLPDVDWEKLKDQRPDRECVVM